MDATKAWPLPSTVPWSKPRFGKARSETTVMVAGSICVTWLSPKSIRWPVYLSKAMPWAAATLVITRWVVKVARLIRPKLPWPPELLAV